MKTLIYNATIVNEGCIFRGSLVIENKYISEITNDPIPPRGTYDKRVDATGCFVLPGVIDDHVHFREPGLTQKADIESESRAAAYGGVTTFFEMPNTIPQTTTLEALNEKHAIARRKSHINYSFFFGATNTNTHLFGELDVHRTPGIKLFMGSSTGNMLVDSGQVLEQVFATAPMLIMTHCEDTALISANTRAAQAKYGEDPAIIHHPEIRSEEACYRSTSLAVRLAKRFHARLHVAHLTTEHELEFFGTAPHITAEAVVAHLLFTQDDYKTKGALIKCNPAIKETHDRDALRRALSDGRITVIGTDHAPHRIEEKQGGCLKAASGMPMIQFSLVAMLGLVDEGVLTLERMVELMSHAPSRLFEVRERGFIRKGYKADLVIVRPHTPWTVQEDIIQSRCRWSPLTEHTFQWQVESTFCNGNLVYHKGVFDETSKGEEILFR